jgi:hypothetical protein
MPVATEQPSLTESCSTYAPGRSGSSIAVADAIASVALLGACMRLPLSYLDVQEVPAPAWSMFEAAREPTGLETTVQRTVAHIGNTDPAVRGASSTEGNVPEPLYCRIRCADEAGKGALRTTTGPETTTLSALLQTAVIETLLFTREQPSSTSSPSPYVPQTSGTNVAEGEDESP